MASLGVGKAAQSERSRHGQQLERRAAEKTVCEDAKESENVIED